MSYQRRMQGQACAAGHCKETELTYWMWEVVDFEKGDMEANLAKQP